MSLAPQRQEPHSRRVQRQVHHVQHRSPPRSRLPQEKASRQHSAGGHGRRSAEVAAEEQLGREEAEDDLQPVQAARTYPQRMPASHAAGHSPSRATPARRPRQRDGRFRGRTEPKRRHSRARMAQHMVGQRIRRHPGHFHGSEFPASSVRLRLVRGGAKLLPRHVRRRRRAVAVPARVPPRRKRPVHPRLRSHRQRHHRDAGIRGTRVHLLLPRPHAGAGDHGLGHIPNDAARHSPQRDQREAMQAYGEHRQQRGQTHHPVHRRHAHLVRELRNRRRHNRAGIHQHMPTSRRTSHQHRVPREPGSSIHVLLTRPNAHKGQRVGPLQPRP
mmetsp:Transcript_41948/g.82046  ORF Transcript_41948/g.82046 Transcript_41948/m.82046 type:complete len:329 (-) Transcript_41948:3539-4525(-)